MESIKFGVEIETVGAGRNEVAAAIKRVVGGTRIGNSVTDSQGRVWKAVYDGSLNYTTHAEVVTPILTYDDLETLQKIIRSIRTYTRAKVDENCGIHIHVDAGAFEAKAVSRLVKIVNKQEKLINAALGIGRHRNQYCQPIDQSFLRQLEQRSPGSLRDLNRIWYGRENMHPRQYHNSRYRGLNLHNILVQRNYRIQMV